MSREPEIFSALERGDIKSVDALLAEEPALANARNARGDSLLLAAVYLGRRPMARRVADAGATIGLIRRTVGDVASQSVAGGIQIQYGGSVTPDNFGAFIAHPDIDGALVGGASLRADQFVEIVRLAAG